ncbi:MAG: IS256 family transposase [Coriobacteriales bacterium]|jgi:putative transposase
MARINITLDQDEILRLLGEDAGDAFQALLQESLDAVLRAESAEQLRAEPYERTEERTDRRNGTRKRPLVTRVGTIELTVPRHRNVPFRTLVFDNYRRSEAALVTAMAEMVVAGVSTAKVGRVMTEICGRSPSKQAVSEACAELDGAVEAFRTRPIEGPKPFLMAEATYLRVRVDHRVVSRALLVAIVFTPFGRREVVGVELAEAETAETWTAFLRSLVGRGLTGVKMFTSDAHEGLRAALRAVLPGVPWQRCQAHLARNVTDAAPKHLRAGLRLELVEMFNCKTLAAARRRRDEIAADYAEAAPRAVEALDAGFEDAMTVMALPEGMRACTRTTNYLERLNREIKRRTKVVGVFPSEASALRLSAAVIEEMDEKWAASRKMYYSPAVEELEACAPKLAEIAREQEKMERAA